MPFLRAEVANGSSFTVEDDTLKYTEKADSDFIDLRFYLESLNKSTSRDATFWLKPGVDGFSSAFAWGKNGQSTDSDLFKISKGALVLGGVKSSATVAKDEWSLIEIVFNYDRTATASDGSLGAFTSYTVKLNGDKIGDITANEGKAYSAIDSFRIFRYTNGSFEIDDLSFVPTASYPSSGK